MQQTIIIVIIIIIIIYYYFHNLAIFYIIFHDLHSITGASSVLFKITKACGLN